MIYPAVELTAAALIAASLLKFGPTLHALVAAFFCATLVTVSATDVLRRVIPNRIVLPAAAVVLVGMTVVEPSPQWAIAAVAASGFLLLAALAYPAGMGMGDVKLALLIGAGLGVVDAGRADARDARPRSSPRSSCWRATAAPRARWPSRSGRFSPSVRSSPCSPGRRFCTGG